MKILKKFPVDNDNSFNIQYYKDILLSNLLFEFFNIDNSCYYFSSDNIYNEFYKFISRENLDKKDRKFVCYLSNSLPPNYEITIPLLNVNSILLLFLQKNYKKEYKYGLIVKEMGYNPKTDKNNDFKKEIYELQKEDLNKIII